MNLEAELQDNFVTEKVRNERGLKGWTLEVDKLMLILLANRANQFTTPDNIALQAAFSLWEITS